MKSKKKGNKIWAITISAGILTAFFTGCSTEQGRASEKIEGNVEQPNEIRVLQEAEQMSETAMGKKAESGEKAKADTFIELKGEKIEMKGGGAGKEGRVVTIHSPGIYEISGRISEGQIIVDTKQQEAVTLILNGADITSGSRQAIYIKRAPGGTVLHLQKGSTNLLRDQTLNEGREPIKAKAMIFSRENLKINGEGAVYLSVKRGRGILCERNLEADQGRIYVNSSSDGMKAKGILTINSGIYVLDTGGKGIASEDALLVNGGVCDISSGGSGIYAKRTMVINRGCIVADSEGNGMDSNGGIGMTGGNVIVYGPENDRKGAINYRTEFKITGGRLFAAGSAERGENVRGEGVAVGAFSCDIPKDTIVNVRDSEGNEVFAFEVPKKCSGIIVAGEFLESAATYDIFMGGSYSTESAEGILQGGSYEGGNKIGSFIPR